jgi:hypothetical protein
MDRPLASIPHRQPVGHPRRITQVKFWLQTKAPAGNWTDVLGSNDLANCVSHARYLSDEHNEETRIVERVDTIVKAEKL